MLSVTGSDGSIYYFGGVWQNVNQTMPNGTITYNRAVNTMNAILEYQVGQVLGRSIQSPEMSYHPRDAEQQST